jgi:hypothetical protein
MTGERAVKKPLVQQHRIRDAKVRCGLGTAQAVLSVSLGQAMQATVPTPLEKPPPVRTYGRLYKKPPPVAKAIIAAERSAPS